MGLEFIKVSLIIIKIALGIENNALLLGTYILNTFKMWVLIILNTALGLTWAFVVILEDVF